MKTEKISIKNFKAIKDLIHDFKNNILIVSGKTGSGKTSFIEAFRFAQTGETPSNPITVGEKEAIVTAEYPSSLVVERRVTSPNKKTTRVLGRTTTGKAAEELLSEEFDVSNKIMKIVTSSEVLSSLKPSELGSIFLTETSEKIQRGDLIDVLNSLTMKEKSAIIDPDDLAHGINDIPADALNEIKALFKEEELTLNDIGNACSAEKDVKKENTALFKIAEAKSKEFLEINPPEYDIKELNDKLEEYIAVEKNIEVYKKQNEAYIKTSKERKEQDNRIIQLELKLKMNPATKPFPEKNKQTKEKIQQNRDTLLAKNKVKQTLSDNKGWFEKTISELSKPVCPISDKIVCNTDRSKFKTDIEAEINKINSSIQIIDDEISKIDETLTSLLSEDKTYQDNLVKYNEKVKIAEEIKYLKEHLITVPEKVEITGLKTDYSKEKKEIKDSIDMVNNYELLKKTYSEAKSLKRKIKISDFIIKALDSKGPVIEAFLKTYKEYLEIAANDRAELLKTGLKIKFVTEDGLKPYFKVNDASPYLPYDSLSSGEKILAVVVLTDLLNSYYNSRVLILDDTNDMDVETFKSLLNFVSKEEVRDLYDNIIIGCTDHDDMLKAISDSGLDTISM